MNRRHFLQAVGAGMVAGSLGLPAGICEATDLGFDLTRGTRTLDLYRPETGERLRLDYLAEGVWAHQAYTRLCWMLRDTHVGQSVQMDTRLIAILDWTQRYLAHYGYTEPLHILSGYRSPETNAATEGAARNSQHLVGRAVDLRIPGLSAEYLGKLFNWLSQGGVGVYSGHNFIHIDTWRVRTWKR